MQKICESYENMKMGPGPGPARALFRVDCVEGAARTRAHFCIFHMICILFAYFLHIICILFAHVCSAAYFLHIFVRIFLHMHIICVFSYVLFLYSFRNFNYFRFRQSVWDIYIARFAFIHKNQDLRAAPTDKSRFYALYINIK